MANHVYLIIENKQNLKIVQQWVICLKFCDKHSVINLLPRQLPILGAVNLG